MDEQVSWLRDLKVTHPAFNEPQVMREARVIRSLAAFIAVNSAELDPDFVKALEKKTNTRMLDILEIMRDI